MGFLLLLVVVALGVIAWLLFRITETNENTIELARQGAKGSVMIENLEKIETLEDEFLHVLNLALEDEKQEALEQEASIESRFEFGEYAALLGGGIVVVLVFAIGATVSNAITRPVQNLASAVGRIGHGEFDVQLETSARDEIGQLAIAVGDMSRKLKTMTSNLEGEVTERKRTEILLADTQRQLERSLDAANVGTWEWNLQDDTHYWDERNKSMFGIPPDEYEGFVLPDFWNRIHPDDLEKAKKAVGDSLKNGKHYNHDFRVVWPDGSVRWLNSRADITRDDDGTPVKMLGACLDITEQKQMEDALRQAQKMQVVGQLTGGVAHDFNNLLAVVMGNLEMVADHLQVGTPVFDYVHNAFTAAERGASLTHHLLAFSRQQVLRPEETNIATLICETKELMSVSMGEKIVMGLHTGDNLWHCKVDKVQLQNAILNLSINARDAMPSGGA
jgi:PAS domain S-box-containing protein